MMRVNDMEQPSDTELMAYADGELSNARASEIEQIARSDAEVQRRINQFRQSRAAIFAALSPLAEEPVPDALRRAVRDMADQTVVTFKPKAKTVAWPPWQMGIAAAFLLMIGGAAGFLAGARPAQEVTQSFSAIGSPVPQEIASHLASLPSGTDATIAAGRLRLIATVLAHGEVPCREFEVDTLSTGQTVAGIACHRNGGWHLEIALVTPAAADGFAPASSFSTLDSYLQAVGASDPLDEIAEQQALRSTAARD
jgi:hypothetical protein